MSKADLRASLLSLQGRTDTLKLVKDEWIFWEIWMKNMDWKNNSDVWCCWHLPMCVLPENMGFQEKSIISWWNECN